LFDIYVLPKNLVTQYNGPTPSTLVVTLLPRQSLGGPLTGASSQWNGCLTVGFHDSVVGPRHAFRATPKDRQSYYRDTKVWSFGRYSSLKTTREAVVAFGRMLIARGIIPRLHSEMRELCAYILGLAASQNHVLHTFVQNGRTLPMSRVARKIPDVILRLSRAMDELCSQEDSRPNLSPSTILKRGRRAASSYGTSKLPKGYICHQSLQSRNAACYALLPRIGAAAG
jgi:hypothetical protein